MKLLSLLLAGTQIAPANFAPGSDGIGTSSTAWKNEYVSVGKSVKIKLDSYKTIHEGFIAYLKDPDGAAGNGITTKYYDLDIIRVPGQGAIPAETYKIDRTLFSAAKLPKTAAEYLTATQKHYSDNTADASFSELKHFYGTYVIKKVDKANAEAQVHYVDYDKPFEKEIHLLSKGEYDLGIDFGSAINVKSGISPRSYSAFVGSEHEKSFFFPKHAAATLIGNEVDLDGAGHAFDSTLEEAKATESDRAYAISQIFNSYYQQKYGPELTSQLDITQQLPQGAATKYTKITTINMTQSPTGGFNWAIVLLLFGFGAILTPFAANFVNKTKLRKAGNV